MILRAACGDPLASAQRKGRPVMAIPSTSLAERLSGADEGNRTPSLSRTKGVLRLGSYVGNVFERGKLRNRGAVATATVHVAREQTVRADDPPPTALAGAVPVHARGCGTRAAVHGKTAKCGTSEIGRGRHGSNEEESTGDARDADRCVSATGFEPATSRVLDGRSIQ